MKTLTYEIVLLKFLCTDVNYFKILGTFFGKIQLMNTTLKKKQQLTNLNSPVITKKFIIRIPPPKKSLCPDSFTSEFMKHSRKIHTLFSVNK